MLSALILFGVFFLTLSLQVYLTYGHLLPSRRYKAHIQHKLAVIRIGDDELEYIASCRRANRFNNKW